MTNGYSEERNRDRVLAYSRALQNLKRNHLQEFDKLYKEELEKVEITLKNKRLTEDDVVKIRRLIRQGELNDREISERFGVHATTINKIRLNYHWKHVNDRD